MANAIPVSRQTKSKAPESEVVTHGGDGALTKDELLARAKDIVESEAPAQILDEQVNQIGQQSNYGKFQRVSEVPYPVHDRKGEVVGERTCIRIDH